eukprot:757316-Hanusia_phi.AAC.5
MAGAGCCRAGWTGLQHAASVPNAFRESWRGEAEELQDMKRGVFLVLVLFVAHPASCLHVMHSNEPRTSGYRMKRTRLDTVVGLSSLVWGLEAGVVTGALLSLQKIYELGERPALLGMIATSATAGSFVGSGVSGKVAGGDGSLSLVLSGRSAYNLIQI